MHSNIHNKPILGFPENRAPKRHIFADVPVHCWSCCFLKLAAITLTLDETASYQITPTTVSLNRRKNTEPKGGDKKWYSSLATQMKERQRQARGHVVQNQTIYCHHCVSVGVCSSLCMMITDMDVSVNKMEK